MVFVSANTYEEKTTLRRRLPVSFKMRSSLKFGPNEDQISRPLNQKFVGYQRKPRHVAHASACAAQSKDCVTILSVAR